MDMAKNRRKKNQKDNSTLIRPYEIVDIKDIDERNLIPVGMLYRSKGNVYLIKPIKKGKIFTYELEKSLGELNQRVDELSQRMDELNTSLVNIFGDKVLTPNKPKEYENDPPNEKEPLIYQIIDQRVEGRFKKIEERLDRIDQRFDGIENLLKDLYSKIDVITKQLSPIKESPPQTTVGEKVYTLTPPQPTPQPQPQSKKLSEEEMEEILAKYNTEKLMEVTKESDFLKLAGTITFYIFDITSEDIKKIYSLDERKQIIEYARKMGYHPARYAAIAKACLDENWNPLIPLTEEELKYAIMPRGLEKDITSN
jgi:tetrahydromethanopterin S-methyltransferase subunit G